MMSIKLPETNPALPPPKCVVLFGDGFSNHTTNNDTINKKHIHLNKLAEDGCVGALMLRNGGIFNFTIIKEIKSKVVIWRY